MITRPRPYIRSGATWITPPRPAAAGRELDAFWWRLLVGELTAVRICVAAAMAGGAVLRFWQLNAVGYNSDEAVYAGQAAALAGDPDISRFFPIFRAHPMLFQFILSLGFQFGVNDLLGRSVAVVIGLATIWLVYRLGRMLYGPWAGAIAALLLSLMPYHVVVTRQVLLDGPATFCTTLTLYFLARYAIEQRPRLLYATAAALGLTFLAKETAFVVAASGYAFLALTPAIKVRLKTLILSAACTMAVIASFPVSIALAGRTETAQSYLVWQLFRRPNHEWTFFPTVVPPAIGPLVLVAALLGLWLLRGQRSWRETLLISWIVFPSVVFQLWPVKGFQYLLPIAPPIAILAGRTLAQVCSARPRWVPARLPSAWLRPIAILAVAWSLAVPSWQLVQPTTSDEFLAGSGGVPGGREMGQWIQENTPEGAIFLTVGPSMANLVQYYGHRKAYGLSVSPNPLHRNPSYEPVPNPDYQIQTSEVQYLVFDSFSSARSPFFGEALLRYVEKYHGHLVYADYTTVTAADGSIVTEPLIQIFEVRP